MAKVNKEEMARREGMSYALRVAKEKGIEELEKELIKRNAYDIPIRISQKALAEFSQNVKHNVVFYVRVMTQGVLADKFDFTKEQLDEFTKHFEERCECLTEDYTSWPDQINTLNEEYQLEIVDDGIDTTVRI